MFKIGEFSKIAQVSIKTLRYYDRLGLLKPAHIDRFNGYRYYNISQLVTLNRILALKDLDFSLDQIKGLLKVDLSGNVLQNMLQDKADELQGRIVDEHARLIRVQSRLAQLQKTPHRHAALVVLKSSPNQGLASIRQQLPNMAHLEEWKQTQLAHINRFLKGMSDVQCGPEITIFHQEDYREEDVDIEVGRIILGDKASIESQQKDDALRLYTLPGVNHLAATVHTSGPISETYAALAGWTQANGFRPIGAWRELTYPQDDPGDRGVIEVQRPVMKAIKFYTQLEEKMMEPKIITKPAFTMVGLPYFGKNEHMEIHGLWGQFNQRMRELGGLPNETGEAAIGLCITPEDPPIDGAFEYVAGLPVVEAKDVPEDFVVRHVPEYTYAVFAHKGDLPSLSKTYEYIYETWLPQSGFQLAAKIDFEYYDQDFKDFAPESVFYIYLPIEKIS